MADQAIKRRIYGKECAQMVLFLAAPLDDTSRGTDGPIGVVVTLIDYHEHQWQNRVS